MTATDKKQIAKFVKRQFKVERRNDKKHHKSDIYADEYVSLIRQLRKYLKSLDNGSKAQPMYRRLSIDAVQTSILPDKLAHKLIFDLKDYTIDFRDGLQKSINLLKKCFENY